MKELINKVKQNKLVMCWTIENKKDYNEIKDFADSVTFQHFDITK